jgi:hypothetical protein
MPYQVSWQSVSMKSQRPVHVLGVEAAVAGEVVVGEALPAAPSAAHASAPHNAPAAARIVATKMPSFVMAAPCLNMDQRDLEKVSYKAQSMLCAALAENFHPSGRRATVIFHGQRAGQTKV